MKNLFDNPAYEEIISRVNKLSANSQGKWGKMDVAQMLCHCKEAFKVPLSTTSPPKLYPLALIGWMMKSKLYNDSPWRRNLPTAPNFKIRDERVFEKEKVELVTLINKFHQSTAATIEKITHPVFGKFTGDQWGMSMYKHLDHHLTQFGA
ncbi:MAG: DUF1569 domain-containing protein [Bacteroidota bacterium]